MKISRVKEILSTCAYARVSGTAEEKRCAEYIKQVCADMNYSATIEPFDVTMYEIIKAKLVVDGREITCKGVKGAGNGTVSGKLYFLQNDDELSLKKCKDKIVLVCKAINSKLYEAIANSGAKGIIGNNGSVAHKEKDISDSEMRFKVDCVKVPFIMIHVSDALEMVNKASKNAEIVLEQRSYVGESQNVIMDIKGETDETVIVCAHYDSTSLSSGVYDNMSGCVALFYIAEYFADKKPLRNIRLLWCGSEERGFLGSIQYCEQHKSELKNHVLNINLDMLGSVIGEFIAFSCADEDMQFMLYSFMRKCRFPGTTRLDVRSSDSSIFVYNDVPAVSFARYAPSGVAMIHTRYDDITAVSPKQLLKDSCFIAKFTSYVANLITDEPIATILEEIREKVEKQLERRLPPVHTGV